MTAPVWFAAPPEVHSALLSSGPGPGALLASAAAWNTLGSEYAAAAAELTALLGQVQAGSWQGPSAEQYVAAHTPYLAWLTQASLNSAGMAAQQETAAAAYSAALAAMPTLAELAANHTVHGVLLATNFLGINTIPIAVNEADYVRMWIQAAGTMTTYQAVSGTALASAPRTTAAPFILTPGVGEAGTASVTAMQLQSSATAADSGSALDNSNIIVDFLESILKYYSDYLNQLFGPIIDFLQDPLGNTVRLITDFLTNPAAALQTWGPFLFAVAYQAFSWVGASLTYPQLLIQPLLGMTLGIVLGIAGNLLNNLPAVPAPAAVAPAAPAPVPARVDQQWPVAGIAPTVPATGVPSAPASAPAGVPAGTAPAAAPAPALPYIVGGAYPDEGVGPTLNEGTGAKAPAADLAAAASAAALASSSEKRKARRRRGAEVRDRGFRDEYLTLDDEPAVPPAEPQPVTQASERGAGRMGFSGTAPRERSAGAAGMTTLADTPFGDGPAEPMLPGTWGEEDPTEHPKPE